MMMRWRIHKNYSPCHFSTTIKTSQSVLAAHHHNIFQLNQNIQLLFATLFRDALSPLSLKYFVEISRFQISALQYLFTINIISNLISLYFTLFKSLSNGHLHIIDYIQPINSKHCHLLCVSLLCPFIGLDSGQLINPDHIHYKIFA